ncbi:MAG: TonB-dependent receptor plug domain-containing protein, partial [Rhodoferax sp.]|nr:TonB-dependent receptor plug domain-containing protein [Rhodoferax sp.]
MFSVSAHAQTAASLPEVVVTANRVQTRADAVIADVTVITRQQIEQGMGRTLAEVLARSGGIQLGSNGGLGNSSSVFVRGTESRHVLL